MISAPAAAKELCADSRMVWRVGERSRCEDQRGVESLKRTECWVVRVVPRPPSRR